MRVPSSLLLLLLLAFACGAQALPDVTLVTYDIDNFWRAYDDSEPGNRRDAFQRLYLNAGSPGLRDFLRLRINSAEALANVVDRAPRFYATIRQNTLQVEAKRDQILLYLSRFRGLYPDARFPPVYFLIGRASTGGTIAPSGLLIGTELFSLGPDVDTSEVEALNPALFRAMGTADKLPLIVVHELAHVQQQFTGRRNLLATSLIEGAADFLTNLVSGATINDHVRAHAEPRRDELFRRFAEDVQARPDALNQWLYNYGTVTGEPADLGYWIGAEICRDHFTAASDKQAALEAIITMRSPESIVRGSRYAWILGSPE